MLHHFLGIDWTGKFAIGVGAFLVGLGSVISGIAALIVARKKNGKNNGQEK